MQLWNTHVPAIQPVKRWEVEEGMSGVVAQLADRVGGIERLAQRQCV